MPLGAAFVCVRDGGRRFGTYPDVEGRPWATYVAWVVCGVWIGSGPSHSAGRRVTVSVPG